MTTRGIWYAEDADPGQEDVVDMIQRAVDAFPQGMVAATVIARLPNGQIKQATGMVTRKGDGLRVQPHDGAESTDLPVNVPWAWIVSVEVA